VVKGGTSLDTAFRLRGANGTYRWFKARSVPIRDSSASILKWYGTCSDVDDLKAAEQAHQQSLERMRSVVDNISEGVVTLDDEWRVVFCNRTAERILGSTRAHLQRRRLVDVLADGGHAKAEAQLEKLTATHTPSEFDAEIHGVGYRARVYPLGEAEGVAVVFDRVARAARRTESEPSS
jgi:PAS domain S-box-containing protein